MCGALPLFLLYAFALSMVIKPKGSLTFYVGCSLINTEIVLYSCLLLWHRHPETFFSVALGVTWRNGWFPLFLILLDINMSVTHP
jgi:hypothetical protein